MLKVKADHPLPVNRDRLLMLRDTAKAEAMTTITATTVVKRISVTRPKTMTGMTPIGVTGSIGTSTGRETGRPGSTGVAQTGSETAMEVVIG